MIRLSNLGGIFSFPFNCSTTNDAITIGRLMRAKFILLTHFSQRFSRLPSFDTFQEDIAPAFDFMQVSRCPLRVN